ncbi:MAG: hypothetical protein CL567_04140 [Alphaproteobacteria bacterium]|nr:hypothetical protein [Alphaproteobacteria bacterium]|tara:strand:- start:2803 stop:3351 length:549 start_codon:yes stop_codon:yes gene_type:complete
MKKLNVNADLILENSFIGATRQICVVTPDFDRTVRSFVDTLGIGPWWINEYRPPEIHGTTFRGKSVEYGMKIGLAWTGEMNWEIIEPLFGPNIYTEFLHKTDGKGGVHHIGFLSEDFDSEWSETINSFVGRGHIIVQEGGWRGVQWVYFEGDDPAQPQYELIRRDPGWIRPEPLRWYPHPPK